MENQICERPAVDEMLDLGMVLGQNQAFGFLAGRCSAAQADTIRRLRNEKLYKRVTEHWREFCPEYLKMSGAQADSIIRLWEEFGAGYFEIAQLTRVSPETYRALAPAVDNGVLNLNGEQIELTIENSRKVAAASRLPSESTASIGSAPRSSTSSPVLSAARRNQTGSISPRSCACMPRFRRFAGMPVSSRKITVAHAFLRAASSLTRRSGAHNSERRQECLTRHARVCAPRSK